VGEVFQQTRFLLTCLFCFFVFGFGLSFLTRSICKECYFHDLSFSGVFQTKGRGLGCSSEWEHLPGMSKASTPFPQCLKKTKTKLELNSFYFRATVLELIATL
jgi:hypothetical protein